jgi:hypothetical protein
MYVDEVGHVDMSAEEHSPSRFLSLTGVIMSLDHARDQLSPRFEALKRAHFGQHPDEPIIFHRKDMMKASGPFHPLRDPIRRSAFDGELYQHLVELEYSVVTVVIDQWMHRQYYNSWANHPYHYCMTALVERYTRWLDDHGHSGDVMAEGRGGREDRELKDVFRHVFEHGTEHLGSKFIQGRLTSRELKIKPKSANIQGLQLSDLLAHPSQRAMRQAHGHCPSASDFGSLVSSLLETTKYRRAKWGGAIEGYGRKWLP